MTTPIVIFYGTLGADLSTVTIQDIALSRVQGIFLGVFSVIILNMIWPRRAISVVRKKVTVTSFASLRDCLENLFRTFISKHRGESESASNEDDETAMSRKVAEETARIK